MTGIVPAQIARALRRIAIELGARGDSRNAKDLVNIAALIVSPVMAFEEPGRRCQRCGKPFTRNLVGRPRVNCPECRAPRTKVAPKSPRRMD